MSSDLSISEILKSLSFLEAELLKVQDENTHLRDENAIFKDKILELESRIKSNSSNSSKPPSSDGYYTTPNC